MNRLIETERVQMGHGQSWNAHIVEGEHWGDRIWPPTVGKPARLERSPLLEKFDPGGARHATDSPIRSLFYKRRDARKRVSADTTGTIGLSPLPSRADTLVFWPRSTGRSPR